MDVSLEYASQILDITSMVLEHSSGLNNDQIQHVERIHRRTFQFIGDYMQNQSVPVQELRRYLNHDALSPVTVIIGYTEVLLMEASGTLVGPYREAVKEINNFGYALHEELKYMHEQVWNFMQQMEIPK
jgi:hypothetical protein